jgi:hypothetical protein
MSGQTVAHIIRSMSRASIPAFSIAWRGGCSKDRCVLVRSGLMALPDTGSRRDPVIRGFNDLSRSLLVNMRSGSDCPVPPIIAR